MTRRFVRPPTVAEYERMTQAVRLAAAEYTAHLAKQLAEKNKAAAEAPAVIAVAAPPPKPAVVIDEQFYAACETARLAALETNPRDTELGPRRLALVDADAVRWTDPRTRLKENAA